MRCFLILAILFLPSYVSAQNSPQKSILSGLVYDDNGAVIVNAVIKIRGVDKAENTFETNSSGEFEINVKPGNYYIQVESFGFQTFTIEKFRVVSSYKGKQDLDIALEVIPFSDCHWIEADAISN